MAAVAIACLPVFFNGYVLKRWEGAVFVLFYAIYVVYLVLDANEHTASNEIRSAILFSGPLILLTLGVVAVRARRQAVGPA
jgi:cation:H+ antiporter